jgi:hypothetical protein
MASLKASRRIFSFSAAAIPQARAHTPSSEIS